MIDKVIPRAHIVKHGARLGAEIKNVKLSGDLSDDLMHAIYQLLLDHKVIFFRDQGHLDDSKQERFAARLGELVSHPTASANARTSSILGPESSRRGGRADRRYTDVTFVDPSPTISVLRGVVIPPDGGHTIWSNTAAAYLDLPAPLRKLADELWAVHGNTYGRPVEARATAADKTRFDRVFTETIYETGHPVVCVHPETDERTLVLGTFLQRFVGLQRHTGEKLVDLLQSYITAPDNTVCWSWTAGDVAIWDNRATQQYAVNDYPIERPARRSTGDDDDLNYARRSPNRAKTSKPQPAKVA